MIEERQFREEETTTSSVRGPRQEPGASLRRDQATALGEELSCSRPSTEHQEEVRDQDARGLTNPSAPRRQFQEEPSCTILTLLPAPSTDHQEEVQG